LKKARIIGTGSYVPEKILTNHDLARSLETTDEWIVTRTGIRERHIVAEGECTSDLAVNAARQAMEMAGITADQLDMIVLGTVTGDFPFPATACIVQQKLGAFNAHAHDVSAACCGFIYALDAATAAIQTGRVQRALVIGAEVLSSIVDWTDRNTCVLFGDGAGAVVLEAQDAASCVLSTHLHSDGRHSDLLYQPGFGSCNRVSEAGVRDGLWFLRMQGNEVFKIAVRSLTEVANEALQANNIDVDDVALFVAHQANLRILEATAKRIGFRKERVYINVDHFGNTSSASIPIALDEAYRGGVIHDGDIVLIDAFGGGLTWASALIRW
jgi:3-oxoacyl-[acyl-carrier-protein] synthase III